MPWRSLWHQKWITQFLYRNHELVTNVRTFAQILMIGEFYGICQSVIEFVIWTQIINDNWNASRVGLCKHARVHSLIHKYMCEGYTWMIRYITSYKSRQENKVVLWGSYMLLIWQTGIIFQIRNWLYCLTAFEIHHHFIMRWHFSLDVLCVKEHEHWYSGISSEFIMHNTWMIGLQIASMETRKSSPYCIFGVIGDVKCTWSESTTCSVSHWKFLKKGGFSVSLPLIVQG